MKLPGPDHPITITANPKRIRVSAGGVVIADTTHALTLKEASYPAVQYVPRSDANMALLQRTERTTHCPYKGDASYYSVVADGKTLENSIWTYETPFPAMAETEDAGHDRHQKENQRPFQQCHGPFLQFSRRNSGSAQTPPT